MTDMYLASSAILKGIPANTTFCASLDDAIVQMPDLPNLVSDPNYDVMDIIIHTLSTKDIPDDVDQMLITRAGTSFIRIVQPIPVYPGKVDVVRNLFDHLDITTQQALMDTNEETVVKTVSREAEEAPKQRAILFAILECQKIGPPYRGWDIEALKNSFKKMIDFLNSKRVDRDYDPELSDFMYRLERASIISSPDRYPTGFNMTLLSKVADEVRVYLKLPSVEELNHDVARMKERARRNPKAFAKVIEDFRNGSGETSFTSEIEPSSEMIEAGATALEQGVTSLLTNITVSVSDQRPSEKLARNIFQAMMRTARNSDVYRR